MIGKVQRGKRINGLIRYLFGPGECNEHVNPHVVAGFRPAAALEPSLRPDGTRDVAELNRLLNQPLALIPEEQQHEKPVRHIVLRAAPEDPLLSDDDWAAIAHEVMDATGRAPYGDDLAVRWVAVRHAPDHIHLAFNLARQDGIRPLAWDDYRALRRACRRIEQRYGLRATAPADGTAAKQPTRAEHERAERSGRSEPVRNTLRHAVQHAAVAASSEHDFFARLRADGVQVRLRHSVREPTQVTGYAVAVPGYTNRAGEPVWFGGGKLAADLTLPRLSRRWARPPHSAPPLTRATLRDTVRHAAAASHNESEFFSTLAEHGIRVRPRISHLDPGEITGYAIAHPDLVDRAGAPVWIAGGRLDPALTLPRMRERWAVAPPGGAWSYAAATVRRAVTEINASGIHYSWAADAAWAGADVLNVTARLVDVRAMRQAAGAYDRTARERHGRLPPSTRIGAELRTAAWILANSTGEERERTQALLTMIEQLGELACAVARLRAAQQRPAQAAAAVRAADLLRAAHADVVQVTPASAPKHGQNPTVRVAQADFPHELDHLPENACPLPEPARRPQKPRTPARGPHR